MSEPLFSSGEAERLLISDFYCPAPPFESQYECREYISELDDSVRFVCFVIGEGELTQHDLLDQVCLIRAASTFTWRTVRVGYRGELRTPDARLSQLEPKENRRDFDFLFLRQNPELTAGMDARERVECVFDTYLTAVNLWEHTALLEPFNLFSTDDYELTEDEAWAALAESARTRNCAWLLTEEPRAPEPEVAEVLARLDSILLTGSGAETPEDTGKYVFWRNWLKQNTETAS